MRGDGCGAVRSPTPQPTRRWSLIRPRVAVDSAGLVGVGDGPAADGHAAPRSEASPRLTFRHTLVATAEAEGAAPAAAAAERPRTTPSRQQGWGGVQRRARWWWQWARPSGGPLTPGPCRGASERGGGGGGALGASPLCTPPTLHPLGMPPALRRGRPPSFHARLPRLQGTAVDRRGARRAAAVGATPRPPPSSPRGRSRARGSVSRVGPSSHHPPPPLPLETRVRQPNNQPLGSRGRGVDESAHPRGPRWDYGATGRTHGAAAGGGGACAPPKMFFI